MANKGPLPCKGCGLRFPRDEMYRPIVGRFCTKDCAAEWAFENKSKGKKLIDRAKKDKDLLREKVFRRQDVKIRKGAAKEACNLYIRTRDKGKKCICCDRDLGDEYHAGHFWESGLNSYIRYDEDNIHGQTIYCNRFKGGNSGFYRERLIEKIGIDRVVRLDITRSIPIKRTADDYKEIEIHYKSKLKQLMELL